MSRIVVDFPEPFGPRKPVTIPGRTENERSFTATVPAVWFENSPAFEISDPSTATAVATYQTTGNPLLSGWLLGGSKLNGKAALVDAKLGAPC